MSGIPVRGLREAEDGRSCGRRGPQGASGDTMGGTKARARMPSARADPEDAHFFGYKDINDLVSACYSHHIPGDALEEQPCRAVKGGG